MGKTTLVKKWSSETPRSESMALGYALGSGSCAERPRCARNAFRFSVMNPEYLK